MVQQFPHGLRAKIEDAALADGRAAAIFTASDKVSARYRRIEGAEPAGQALQIKSRDEALAYMLTRLPATFASNMRAFENVGKLLPDFSPETVLDIGAGPGTASLAASFVWDAGHFTLLEPNSYLREAGREFLEPEISTDVQWIERDLKREKIDGAYDLVLASYVFNEIAEEDRPEIIKKLWESCKGLLVIVETGTPQGFSVIRAAREFAKSQDGCFVIGPCPQSGACPLQGEADRWCHFSVRVERSRLHKNMKSGATLGYEDEKFSWAALGRFSSKCPEYRIIGAPSGGKVLYLQVCGVDGIARTLEVPKSSDLYRRVKKLEWGDGFDE